MVLLLATEDELTIQFRVNGKIALLSRSYHNENSASARSSMHHAQPRSESRALFLPISWDRRSQNLRPVLCYQHIIFDANAAAPDVVTDSIPVYALSILSASFRIVEDGRDKIQARLNGREVADSKRQVHPQIS